MNPPSHVSESSSNHRSRLSSTSQSKEPCNLHRQRLSCHPSGLCAFSEATYPEDFMPLALLPRLSNRWQVRPILTHTISGACPTCSRIQQPNQFLHKYDQVSRVFRISHLPPCRYTPRLERSTSAFRMASTPVKPHFDFCTRYPLVVSLCDTSVSISTPPLSSGGRKYTSGLRLNHYPPLESNVDIDHLEVVSKGPSNTRVAPMRTEDRIRARSGVSKEFGGHSRSWGKGSLFTTIARTR
ncbi:hypothetical protein BDM02DRAFT_3119714 [Thelephora ganbajun]|uniref:Uncharacterized protein n=1 Tax=Thelephora ganbajun TaxID=370292 RepID=A0ACB6Z8F9_THEGA|nr:hypothetical protein BDM02DRAFT_3119714 [Thelephora ganbajun]